MTIGLANFGGNEKEGVVVFTLQPCLWGRYFYGLGWTLSFTGKALNAICFSGGVRLLFGSGMSRAFSPFKHVHGADVYTDAVSSAAFPVNSHCCSVDSKFCRRLHGSPDIVTLMLIRNFSILREVCVYWHGNFTYAYIKRLEY